MFEIVIFFVIFEAFMIYRMVNIWRNRGTPKVKAKADRGIYLESDEDEDVINDPGMFWHPLNNYHRD